MKKLLSLFVVLSLMTAPSFAAFNTDGLTPAQVAKLQADAAQLAETNSIAGKTPVTPPSGMAKEVVEYAQLGQALGTGLATTARELGIAVNEFAASPIGKVATFVIVFKLIGKDLLHIPLGLLWFFCMIPLWVYFFRRLCFIKSRVLEHAFDGNGKVLKIRRRTEYFDDPSDTINGTRVVMLIVLAIIVAVGFIVI